MWREPGLIDPLDQTLRSCLAGVESIRYEADTLLALMSALEEGLIITGADAPCLSAIAAWRGSFQTFSETLEQTRTSARSLVTEVERFVEMLSW